MSVDVGEKVTELLRKASKDIIMVGLLLYATPKGGIMPIEGYKAIMEIGCCGQYFGHLTDYQMDAFFNDFGRP